VARRNIKTLKFAHNLVEKILCGTKTVTWRLFDDKNLTAGDRLEFVDSDTGKKFAEAEIIKVREKKLGEVEENDFEGHERYEDNNEMLRTYKRYYGERADWNTVVKIIEFKLPRAEE